MIRCHLSTFTVALALAMSPLSSFAQDAADPLAAEINRAIDRGVAFLRSEQGKDGTWDYSGHELGITALCGLALLESEVPRDHPAIIDAERVVRRLAGGAASASQRKPHPSAQTYDVSLAILFLSKLYPVPDEDREVRELIQTLGWRLAASERSGRWHYPIDLSPDFEKVIVERTRTTLPKQAGDLASAPPSTVAEAGRPGLDAVAGAPAVEAASPRPDPKETPTPSEPEAPTTVASKKAQRAKRSKRDEAQGPHWGDNSNTQFGMLGVWVAGLYDYDSAPTLERLDRHFRTTQQARGGWGYHIDGSPGSPAMDCVGLLGLFLAATRDLDASDPEAAKSRGQALFDDPAFREGLRAVTERAKRINPSANRDGLGARTGRLDRQFGTLNNYDLWSLERACVAIGLPTLDGLDWYREGARDLLNRQGADGSWEAGWSRLADTSFALLFLRRSNLAPGARTLLQGPGTQEIKKPGLLSFHGPTEPDPPPPATEPPADAVVARSPEVVGPNTGKPGTETRPATEEAPVDLQVATSPPRSPERPTGPVDRGGPGIDGLAEPHGRFLVVAIVLALLLGLPSLWPIGRR